MGDKRVLGPQEPVIGRIRNLYIEEIYIKLEKKGVSMGKIKSLIYRMGLEQKKLNDFKNVRLYFDVDPV